MLPYVVSYLYSAGNQRRRLISRIIFQCAPFFKGLKVSALISLDYEDLWTLDDIFSGTDIKCRVLAEGRRNGLAFLFREKEFKSCLNRKGVGEFLEDFGYIDQDMEAVLLRLSKRTSQTYCKDKDFPHEIGVFLDYPLEDVKGFIREKGRNSLLNGYWKVYHNPGKAQMTFHAYDKAKVSAVNELLMGKTLGDIIQPFFTS
ncbi:MAG: DUF3793 family protein [Lachnospiraceae bacterium]